MPNGEDRLSICNRLISVSLIIILGIAKLTALSLMPHDFGITGNAAAFSGRGSETPGDPYVFF
jgi:hypothetical protein